MICACGEEIADWIRFHWTSNEDGHYVDGRLKGGAGALAPDVPTPTTVHAVGRQTASEGVATEGKPPRGKKMPAHLKRASELFGAPPRSAPAFLEVPPKALWTKEADVRLAGAELLRSLGYAVYDLEQGFRRDGSSRQTEGIGDQYFIGTQGRDAHLRFVQGWIEYKRWDNEPSPEQRTFAREVLSHGGIYLLVYDVEQLTRWQQLASSKGVQP